MSGNDKHDPGAPAWRISLERMRAEAAGADARSASVDSGPVHPANHITRDSRHFSPSQPTLPEDWRDRRYVALDFETTGLDSRRDRVIEIGLFQFRLDSGNVMREEASLALFVHPAMPIPPQASLVHGIYDLDVSSAPLFFECMGQVESMLEGRTVIAHNASFDVGFLRSEYVRAGAGFREPPTIDTLSLSRKAFPGLASYSLGTLVRRFGIEGGMSHRALDDSRSCAALFHLCARRLSE